MKKKIGGLLLLCFGIAVTASQFIAKKPVPVQKKISSKECLADFVAIEQAVPELLHATAKLLACMHDNIALCIDGANECIKKLKEPVSVELYKKKIAELQEAMTILTQKSDDLCSFLQTTCQTESMRK